MTASLETFRCRTCRHRQQQTRRPGRDFDRNDDALHAPVMIVNPEFVRRFLGGRGAIGRKVHGWGRWFTIVGVARDSKHYRLSEGRTPYFHVPLRGASRRCCSRSAPPIPACTRRAPPARC